MSLTADGDCQYQIRGNLRQGIFLKENFPAAITKWIASESGDVKYLLSAAQTAARECATIAFSLMEWL